MLHGSPGGLHPGVRQRPLRHSSPEQHPALDVHGSVTIPQVQVPAPVPASPGRAQRAPPQQSRSERHGASPGWHTHACVVLSHSIDPQQSNDVTHDPIAGWQQNDPPGCTAHAKSPQHAVTLGVHTLPWPTHIAPSASTPDSPVVRPSLPLTASIPLVPLSCTPASIADGRRQALSWHVSPEQQSELATQYVPDAWHAHIPLRQSIAPQHSMSVVHPWPCAAQQ